MLKLSLVISLLAVSDHGTQSVTDQVEHAIIFHLGKTLTEFLFSYILSIGTKIAIFCLLVHIVEQVAVFYTGFMNFLALEQCLNQN